MSPLAPLPDPVLREGTALLVVDMQYFDAHREYGMALMAAPGEDEEYFEQVDEVLPRIRRLQDCARSHGIPVVHTHLCSRAPDGAEM
jgi:nicotinamidase-related amidase